MVEGWWTEREETQPRFSKAASLFDRFACHAVASKPINSSPMNRFLADYEYLCREERTRERDFHSLTDRLKVSLM